MKGYTEGSRGCSSLARLDYENDINGLSQGFSADILQLSC